MSTKLLVQIVLVFCALLAAGTGLIVFGGASPLAQARAALPLVGTALISSAVTFFLVELFRSGYGKKL
jgi:hypothetical protein